LGLEVHAGHGIDYETVSAIAAIPQVMELNIGHFLIGESISCRPVACHCPHAPVDGRRPGRGCGVIIGIGSDLSDIRRIQGSLDRFGTRFTNRIFTELERSRSDRKTDPASSYAKRFAAKEACAKALGTGMRAGVFWRDMGVVNMRSGQPTMALTGGALTRLNAMTPEGIDRSSICR